MRVRKMQQDFRYPVAKPLPKSYVENINLNSQGHPLSDNLAGKAVRLEYRSGHILEQHWQASNKVLWKSISGPLEGYQQSEYYRSVKLTEDMYLITWVEESTVASASASQTNGPWLTDVILDFKNMWATASWMGPIEDGGAEYVLDQATMIFIECDMCIEQSR